VTWNLDGPPWGHIDTAETVVWRGRKPYCSNCGDPATEMGPGQFVHIEWAERDRKRQMRFRHLRALFARTR
jgi:hypothetical protein